MASFIRKNLLDLAPLAVIVLYYAVLALNQAFLVRLSSGLLVLSCLLTSSLLVCVVIMRCGFPTATTSKAPPTGERHSDRLFAFGGVGLDSDRHFGGFFHKAGCCSQV